MPRVLLELEARPRKSRTARLVMTDEGITINDEAFRWAAIDRVYYRAVDHYLNGGYQRTTFTIMVGTASRKATFVLISGTTGALKTKIDHAKRDENQGHFREAVGILNERLCARLIEDLVTTVLRGDTLEIAGLRIDRQGIHQGKVFHKSVPWPEIAGTDLKSPYLMILARQGTATKPRLKVIPAKWNAVLLPYVITALTRQIPGQP